MRLLITGHCHWRAVIWKRWPFFVYEYHHQYLPLPLSLSLSLNQPPFSSVFFPLFLFFSKIFSSSSSRIFSSILSCFNIRCNNNGILRKEKNRFINFMYIYICITGKRIAERCAINYDYCNEYSQSLYIIFRTSHKIYFIFEIFLLTEDRQ